MAHKLLLYPAIKQLIITNKFTEENEMELTSYSQKSEHEVLKNVSIKARDALNAINTGSYLLNEYFSNIDNLLANKMLLLNQQKEVFQLLKKSLEAIHLIHEGNKMIKGKLSNFQLKPDATKYSTKT